MSSRPGASVITRPMQGLRSVYGSFTLFCVAAKLTHVIAFRVTAGEGRRLQALRTTFPEQRWGDMFRWLLSDPRVDEVIRERLAEDQVDPPKSFGAEASLPVGDR